MRPVLPLLLMGFLVTGCSQQGTVQPTGPVLSLRMAQENGLVLKVGFGNSENKVVVQNQAPIRLKNHLLSVTGTIGLSKQMVLDIQVEVDTKKSLKLEFAGFPEAAILRDGKQSPAAVTLTPGKHQFRVTYTLIPPSKAREKASGQSDPDTTAEDP